MKKQRLLLESQGWWLSDSFFPVQETENLEPEHTSANQIQAVAVFLLRVEQSGSTSRGMSPNYGSISLYCSQYLKKRARKRVDKRTKNASLTRLNFPKTN